MSNTLFYNTVIIIQHVFISLIGVVGNFFVLLVYKNKLKDNQSITFFIVHLAITDLACCLFLIPINCYHEIYLGKMESDFACKFHSFLNIMNITYSCLLMALVALERFFSIIYPFKKILTKNRTKLTMAILFMFCLGIGLLGSLGIGVYHRVFTLPSNMTGFFEINFHETTKVFRNTTSFDSENFQSENNQNLGAQNMLRIKRSTTEVIAIKNHEDEVNRTPHDFNKTDTLLAYTWVNINNCFPNDKIIRVQHFTYIRLFQNLIVVFCFTFIFILYAFICIFVSKRRCLKLDRQKRYNKILNGANRNNAGTMTNSVKEPNANKKSLLRQGVSIDMQSKSLTEDRNEQIPLNEFKNLKNFNGRNRFDSETIKEIDDTSFEEGNENANEVKTENTNLKAPINISNTDANGNENLADTQRHSINLYHTKYSSVLLANLKTAFMLFVVTLIMAIVYTPALLISLNYISYNPIYWNLIYVNNAVNPLIYGFMNTNFRKSLRKLLFNI